MGSIVVNWERFVAFFEIGKGDNTRWEQEKARKAGITQKTGINSYINVVA